jgi:hypothetical protein
MRRTLNSESFREQAAQRSTLNVQLPELNVERWTLDVERLFL